MATKVMEEAADTSASEPSLPINELANHEIVTLAVYLCGGASRAIDTEDIAVKAFELAPKRFSWRRHKEQISLDAVRKRLWDAKSTSKGYCYVSGSERKGWSLTPDGFNFAKAHAHRFDREGADRSRLSADEKRWATRERARLLDCTATQKVLHNKAAAITKREAEEFFRLDDYVTGTARKRKVHRVINLLGDDETLGPIITLIADKLLEESVS